MSGKIDELIQKLGSNNRKERRKAIDELKEVGKPASVRLLNVINSESPEVRDGAAEILGTYSEENIDTFIKLLVSGRENARDGAARTIAYIADNGGNISGPLSKTVTEGKPEAKRRVALALGYAARPGNEIINMLLYLLRDESRKVRSQAAESLEELNWSSKSSGEMAFFYLAGDNWKELGRIGAPATEALKFGLEKGNADDRVNIAGVLAGNDSRESGILLLKLLGDKDKSVRLAAIEAIADKGDRSLMNALVKTMDDADHDVRVEASWALKKTRWNATNGRDYVKSLILQGNFRGVELMGEAAVPFLIENLGDGHADFREDTIKLLYTAGPSAAKALREAKNSSNPAIKRGAVEAIKYFNEENRKTDERKRYESSVAASEIRAYNSRDFWYQALSKNYFSPDLAGRLSNALSNPDDIIKITGIETLKGYGKQAIPVLILLLDDEEKDNVKTVAIETLGDLYAKDAIDAIVKTFEDGNYSVRRASAYSLGKIRDKGTLPVLVRHFADPNETVRFECSESVAKMGNVALPFLENLVTHSDPDVRITAIMALGGISDPSGIIFVTKALNDPEHPVRLQAMDSLEQISGFMFNFLMKEITRVSIQGTKMEKLGMLSVLSRLNDLKIIPIVKNFLSDKDEEVRRNAAEILEIYRKQEQKKERAKIREYSRETADLLKRKLSLQEIDGLLDSLLGSNDEEVMEMLGGKLSQDEIDELIRSLSSGKEKDTAKLLGKRLSQDEIDELIHRSAYVSNKNTIKLLGNKLNQDEIDDLIKRAMSEAEENTAKDIKKQLTQNEIDDIIKKELELKQKVAMEVSRLIIGLKSEDSATKSESAEKIVKIGEPAVEPLLNVMNNAEPEFQDEIADLMIRLDQPGIRGMIRTLNYGKPEMRIVVARNILKSSDKEALNAVYDRIKSEKDPEVKKALLLTFAKDSKDKRIPEALTFSLGDKDHGVKTLAIRLLGKVKDESVITPLISVFNNPDRTLYELAEESIMKYGDKAGPYLIKELRGGGSDLFRGRVAGTIEKLSIRIKDKDDLAWFLSSKNRWSELKDLGTHSIEPLSAIIRDPYSGKRAEALKVLIDIGGKETVRPISEACFDMDEEISTAAKEYLMKKGKEIVPVLSEIASGETDLWKKEELNSIVREIRLEEDVGGFIRTGNWDELVNTGPPAIKYLTDTLKSAEGAKKRDIVSTISRIGGEESVYPLSDSLFDPDERISGIARDGIMNAGGSAVPVLNEIAENTKNPARREILNFLIMDISEKEELRTLIREGRWAELEAKGEQVIESILPLLDDPDPNIRMGALGTISGIGGINAIGPLLHSLFDVDAEISQRARRRLVGTGRTIIPVISVASFKEKDRSRKKILTDLIKEIDGNGNDHDRDFRYGI